MCKIIITSGRNLRFYELYLCGKEAFRSRLFRSVVVSVKNGFDGFFRLWFFLVSGVKLFLVGKLFCLIFVLFLRLFRFFGLFLGRGLVAFGCGNRNIKLVPAAFGFKLSVFAVGVGKVYEFFRFRKFYFNVVCGVDTALVPFCLLKRAFFAWRNSAFGGYLTGDCRPLPSCLLLGFTGFKALFYLLFKLNYLYGFLVKVGSVFSQIFKLGGRKVLTVLELVFNSFQVGFAVGGIAGKLLSLLLTGGKSFLLVGRAF